MWVSGAPLSGHLWGPVPFVYGGCVYTWGPSLMLSNEASGVGFTLGSCEGEFGQNLTACPQLPR